MSDLITTHGFPQAPVWSEHRRGLTAVDSLPVDLPRTAGASADCVRWAHARVRLIVGDPTATTTSLHVCYWDEVEEKWAKAADFTTVQFSSFAGQLLPGMFSFEPLGRPFLVAITVLTASREIDIDVAGAGRAPGYA